MDQKTWLAFAGGASVALLADRVLSPFLAQGMSALDQARGQDPFDLLAADHRRFSDLLEQMEHAQGRGLAWRTQLLVRLKRGLAAHAMAEEDVIYPLLHDEAHAEAAAEALYTDHGLIKTHLYALERGIKDERGWIRRASELKDLIERHARQEEEVEFPRLRALMDREAIAQASRHVRREKAMLL